MATGSAAVQTTLDASTQTDEEDLVVQLHQAGFGATRISHRVSWSFEKVDAYLTRRGYFNEDRCDMEAIRELGERFKELFEGTSRGVSDVIDELECSKTRALGAYRYVTDRVGEKQTRPPYEYRKHIYEKIESPDVVYYTPVQHGYSIVLGVDWPDDKKEQVVIHRLVAVAEYGFDAVADNQVHHKNGVPWDNRPENLEVLTQREHIAKHWHSDNLLVEINSATDRELREALANAGYVDAAELLSRPDSAEEGR